MENLTYEQYAQRPGLRSSFLRNLLRSPLHAKHESTQTKSMAIGSATHTAILEPAQFNQRYVCMDEKVNLTTTIGKDKMAAFQSLHQGKEVIRYDDAVDIRAMVGAVRRNGLASALIEACAMVEKSLFWEMDGVDCKCRPDGAGIHRKRTFALDIKTMRDASKRAASNAIFGDLRYYLQEAWYRHGLAHNDVLVEDFYFICIENTAPHGVAVYQLDPGAIEAGEEEIERGLNIYKKCQKMCAWPGYPETPTLLLKPAWLNPDTGE